MSYLWFLVTIVIIILICVNQIRQLQLSNKSTSPLTFDRFIIPYKLKKDCQVDKVYCFDNRDCFHKCSIFRDIEFTCQTGTCKVSTNSLPLHQCDLKNGEVPYLIGIPELGTADWICKSVDLGIVKYNHQKKKYENIMCKGGEINTNYEDAYPEPHDCKCPEGLVRAIVPATELKRPHVECVNKDKFSWAYDTNGLVYHGDFDD